MSDDSTASASEAEFISFGDIKVAHLELLRQASEAEVYNASVKHSPDAEPDGPPNTHTIRIFLDKAKQAGRTIGQKSERRGVQRILDYWSAELAARPGITKTDISATTLAAFEGSSTEETQLSDPGAAHSGSLETAQVELTKDEQAERLRIRVAAQARQWANTKYDGYLLRGSALDEATKLALGPDIDAFIQASLFAEEYNRKDRDRIKNRLIAAFVSLSFILAAVAIYAFFQAEDASFQANEANQARKASEEKAREIQILNNDLQKQFAATKRALADARRKAIEIANLNKELQAEIEARTSALDAAVKSTEAAEQARLQLEAALLVAGQKAEDANKRTSGQEDAQASLAAAIRVIVGSLAQGRVRLDDLDYKIRRLVLVQLVGDVKGGALKLEDLPPALQDTLAPMIDQAPNALPSNLPGYQTSFVEADIPLPRPTGALREDAREEPLNYVNYSLLMSKSRRMALYAAVNLDRSQRLILQAADNALHLDKRIGVDAQPSLAWYASVWSPAQLASTGDVAWGPAFSGDPTTAALKLSLYTGVLPNSVPQPSSLAGGAWMQLDNWVRNEHNPFANRVTIFAGPMFEPGLEELRIDGVPVPSAYWKIAVSSVSTAVKGAAEDPEFKVDAFLIPRDPTATQFDPSTFRISIAELERRTALDFGYLIRWTDSVNHPALGGKTVADELAGQVGLLDSTRKNEREAILNELQATLGDTSLPISERRKVVAALANMASTVNMLPLSRDGRLNVLQALTWVPEDLWRRSDWLPVWAQARVAAGDLEVREANGSTNIGQQTRQLLDRLKRQLGIEPSPQKVYLRFAGMTRGAAETLSARMRAVGWSIPKPGEERTPVAAGRNEVRYNPDNGADRAAATMLAADLTAAGQMVEAKPVSGIVSNIVQIWISR